MIIFVFEVLTLLRDDFVSLGREQGVVLAELSLVPELVLDDPGIREYNFLYFPLQLVDLL